MNNNEWKRGWGRHNLVALQNYVCEDCIVSCMCERVCREYHMIHGVMLSWSRKHEYDTSEEEFNVKLRDVAEDFLR